MGAILLLVANLADGGSEDRLADHLNLVPETSRASVNEAIARIQHSVDPCGESSQVMEVLNKLRECARGTYGIRASSTADRNVFDRPISPQADGVPTTITWNPELRSELERACDGDPSRPVLRDPTASLLHELVHAVQDCQGLNPGDYELEAVRVENIYRRAAGLCQRSGYGEDPLPRAVVRICAPGDCPCSVPQDRGTDLLAPARRAPEACRASDVKNGDSAR